MLSPQYADLVEETGERLCAVFENGAPALPLANASLDPARNAFVVGDARGVLWCGTLGRDGGYAIEGARDLVRLETVFALIGGSEPPRRTTRGRAWAAARIARGSGDGELILVSGARRDVCAVSLEAVRRRAPASTAAAYAVGAPVRVVARHAFPVTCVSEASLTAVATGDRSGSLRVVALGAAALGPGGSYHPNDPFGVEALPLDADRGEGLLGKGVAERERAHEGSVTAAHLVADPPDARVVISGGSDHAVRVWAFGAADGVFRLDLAREFSCGGGFTPTALAPTAFSDATLLAVGGAEGTLALWRVDGARGELLAVADDADRAIARLEIRGDAILASDAGGCLRRYVGLGRRALDAGTASEGAPTCPILAFTARGLAVYADGTVARPLAATKEEKSPAVAVDDSGPAAASRARSPRAAPRAPPPPPPPDSEPPSPRPPLDRGGEATIIEPRASAPPRPSARPIRLPDRGPPRPPRSAAASSLANSAGPADRDAERARRELEKARVAAGALETASRAEAAAQLAADAAVGRAAAHDPSGDLVDTHADLPQRTRVVGKQVDPRYLEKLDALRPRAEDFALPPSLDPPFSVPIPPYAWPSHAPDLGDPVFRFPGAP